MFTFLLFVQLSAAPLTPPQKPMEFPEKQPAMFAREIEITEEVRRRDNGKVLTFTLLPDSDVVVLVCESSIDLASAPSSTIFARPQSSGLAQSLLHHKKILKKSPSGSQIKYNRRGKRNW